MDQDRLAEVIARAQRRDAAAFEALIEAYGKRLYGFLYRLTGHRDDADDLLQEVFVRVVRMIDKYEHEGRFEAWLFRIAVNLTRDRGRRAGRSPMVSATEFRPSEGDDFPDILDQAGARDAPPDRVVELADQIDRLQWALAQLNEAEREVIMLRHFADMPFSDIAQVMGTPLGTALARAHRGLRRLREILEGPSKS
jgi:RNA polymerase sigma-70 factor, ECF subfamily